MFQPLLNKFVGTPSHLVETLATLKGVLLNHHLGGQRFSDSRSTGSSHGTEAVGNAVRYYYDALSDYIKSTILSNPYYQGYELLFTGHSLGGGVAQIVAARLEGVAVVFSAPGVVLSRKKFKISLDNIDAYAINVWAVGDLVPLIDEQSVKSQQVRCSHERFSYHCHSILHTIDEIEGSCKDEEGP
ncbi:hypothetical protein NSK_003201 [Nannochloropsis salina CCMP1776]|nr:hypothetical protein NSK_003201 [Nannochloropsis salina CCMP1776]|eukprot:TFJ85693.1 hypothetical protein NSK_003201 [Nannochloropsis salina CCMP1776]